MTRNGWLLGAAPILLVAASVFSGCTGSTGSEPSEDAGETDGGPGPDAGQSASVDSEACSAACGELASCEVVSGVLIVTGRCDASEATAVWMADTASVSRMEGTLNVGGQAETMNFSNLIGVSGSLSMRGPFGNTHVEFPKLEAVGGALSIPAEQGIVSMSAPLLEDVGGVIDVFGNQQLTGLYLSAIQTVGGGVAVSGNPNLETIDLGALTFVGGDFLVEGNPSLSTCALEDHIAGIQVVGDVEFAANDPDPCTQE